MKAAIHSLASLWVPCGGFASPSSLPASLHVWASLPGFAPCSVCGLHSVFCVCASLLFASQCSVCSCVASLCLFVSSRLCVLCAPCVGFAYSNVSAVPDCSVKLSCIRPLLSLAMRLAIPHCMTLIITPLLPMSLQFQTAASDSPACDLYSRLR